MAETISREMAELGSELARVAVACAALANEGDDAQAADVGKVLSALSLYLVKRDHRALAELAAFVVGDLVTASAKIRKGRA
jgi:hypothetical protein